MTNIGAKDMGTNAINNETVPIKAGVMKDGFLGSSSSFVIILAEIVVMIRADFMG
ncbi:hypothetical protein OSCI_2840002 [Kamptonema sp. PCC 6506]|nr:hypothetical protein OSCI_2840002 [Kamptonema sp. PCC 6506]